VKQETQIKADSGYSDIQKTHVNSQIPHKSSKLKKLTKNQKRENQELSNERVLNEHVIGRIKRFRIIKDTFTATEENVLGLDLISLPLFVILRFGASCERGLLTAFG